MRKILLTLAITAGALSMQAQDWPQFMGPDRNGISQEKGIMKSWPAEGPKVLWSTDLGIGFGGPVIKAGKIYLLDRDDETGDTMRCYDLQTGKELWNYNYDAPGSVMFPGSRTVPVVDDKHVYSCGPYGDLYCIDINTHQPVWHKNVWKDYGGGQIPQWAISQCPLLYGDLLIIASQAPGAGVVAYDKNTGAEKWKTASLGPTGYVSPTLVKIDGTDHVVMVTASEAGGFPGGPQREAKKGSVVGIEPLTGKILWRYDNWECHIPVACATDAGNNKMLIVGGYERGATMLQVNKGTNDAYEVKELFTTTNFGDQTKPAVFYNGYFYAQYRTNNKRDGMVCMDMEGNIKWKTRRSPDFNRGSIIIVDGMMLATDGAKSLYLIEPNPNEYKQIAKAELLIEKQDDSGNNFMASFGTQNWAPMALSNGKLLLRDQTHMICVNIK
ncbi:MAG: PQQ-binding-like beta-propeller repeat protein [Bacteroidaceae bacterium]|nr:PQQ-binding-like beta-propeller repeat protein [Bacteroidaceae bacterium]